jgi:hypothetical protein
MELVSDVLDALATVETQQRLSTTKSSGVIRVRHQVLNRSALPSSERDESHWLNPVSFADDPMTSIVVDELFSSYLKVTKYVAQPISLKLPIKPDG